LLQLLSASVIPGLLLPLLSLPGDCFFSDIIQFSVAVAAPLTTLLPMQPSLLLSTLVTIDAFWPWLIVVTFASAACCCYFLLLSVDCHHFYDLLLLLSMLICLLLLNCFVATTKLFPFRYF